MPRKGRARRFREARKLKQGYDDGLFREGSGTLADVDEDDTSDEDDDDSTTTGRRRRRGLGPGPPAQSSAGSAVRASRQPRVRGTRRRSRSRSIASATASAFTSPVWASPSSTATVTCAASTSKWRRSDGPDVGEAVAVGAEHRRRAAGTNRAIESGTARTQSVTATIGPSGAGELLGDVRRARRRRPGAGGSTARSRARRRAAASNPGRSTRRPRRRGARRAICCASSACNTIGPLARICARCVRSPSAARQQVHAAHDAVLDAFGHRRLHVVLVVEREVVEAVLGFGAVHAPDAVAHEHADFVRERGVVRPAVRVRERVHLRLAVAVLQTLRRSASCGPRSRRAGSRGPRWSPNDQMRSPTRWNPNIE